MSDNQEGDPKVNAFLSDFFGKLRVTTKNRERAEDGEQKESPVILSHIPKSSKAAPVGLVGIFSNRQKLLNLVLLCLVLFLLFIVWNKDSETTVVSAKSHQVKEDNKSNLGQQAEIHHQKELLALEERKLALEAEKIKLEEARTRIAEPRTYAVLTQKPILDLSGINNCDKGALSRVDTSIQEVQVTGRTCTIVIFRGRVSGVQGKWYQLAVPDPMIPGNFYKCGDAGGQNDSEAECAEFATRYSGREIRIAVLDGGYLYMK